MPTFDHIFVLDWSARSTPSPARPTADAVWLAELDATRATAADAGYFRTRAAGWAALTRRLIELVDAGRRVLVGVDFALGYPAGFAAAAGLGPGDTADAGASPSPAWRAVWNHLEAAIHDGTDNANNRVDVATNLNRRVAGTTGGPHDGPFWGRPGSKVMPWLSPGRPPGLAADRATPTGLPRRRIVEQRVPRAQEVWKLYGIGSVGSQTLLGIARCAALRHHPALRGAVRAWPFETGWDARLFHDQGVTRGGVVLAEVYPSLVNDAAAALLAERPGVAIKDQAQTIALAEHLAAAQRSDTLGVWLAGPSDLSAETRARCETEEGWILGV